MAFTDSKGRTWNPRITGLTIVDFENETGDGFFQMERLTGGRFLTLLWHSIKAKAQTDGVTRNDFLESILGEHMKGAQEAIQGALADFTRNLPTPGTGEEQK